jgi:hypothetical protein
MNIIHAHTRNSQISLISNTNITASINFPNHTLVVLCDTDQENLCLIVMEPLQLGTAFGVYR